MATVLIVEDEAVLLVLAESVLQTAGYETLTASSLPELQGIVESDTAFDVLFTDLTLHEDHDAGIEGAKLVAEKRPGTPVLYTSGRAASRRCSSRTVISSKSPTLTRLFWKLWKGCSASARLSNWSMS